MGRTFNRSGGIEMEIKLKDNEYFGYGIEDEHFYSSDAKTLDELIEEIKSDGYLEDEDEEWAYVFITRPIDSKSLIKRWLEDYFDRLDDVCFDEFIGTEEGCQITIDLELLDMLDKKISISATHTGHRIGIVNINTGEFKEE